MHFSQLIEYFRREKHKLYVYLFFIFNNLYLIIIFINLYILLILLIFNFNKDVKYINFINNQLCFI